MNENTFRNTLAWNLSGFQFKSLCPLWIVSHGHRTGCQGVRYNPSLVGHLFICSLRVLRLQISSDLSPLLLLSLLQPFVKLCIVLFFLCQNSSSLGTPDFCLTLECYFLLCIKLHALSCAGVGLWKDAWCDLTSSLIFCSVLFCFKFCLWQQTCLQFLCSEGFLFGTSICNKWICYLQRYF